eukprot:sb/3472279/
MWLRGYSRLKKVGIGNKCTLFATAHLPLTPAAYANMPMHPHSSTSPSTNSTEGPRLARNIRTEYEFVKLKVAIGEAPKNIGIRFYQNQRLGKRVIGCRIVHRCLDIPDRIATQFWTGYHWYPGRGRLCEELTPVQHLYEEYYKITRLQDYKITNLTYTELVNIYYAKN